MCGIVGAFALNEPLPEAWLGPPLRALAHRGPDGEGRWVSADRLVALGHRRLAIIDRAGGAQPLACERGDLIAVVSGELYDYAKLHRELCGRGHRFRSKSDSELLLHLYAEYGIDFVRHLRGEFAFILWDKRQRLGIAGRDRFGIRPLVYARLGDAYCFASEGKALLAAGVSAAWDLEAVFAATQMQYPAADRTLFREIHQLEPGEIALVSAGRLRIRRYWDLDYPRVPELPAIGEGEAVREVEAALREAVRIRLSSEVPIAFQLSGGLDSSAVVALAAAELGRPPLCYTVAFDRPGYDERALAEETARHVGAQLRIVEVSAAAVAERLPEAIAHSEGLAINGHIAAKHLLSERMRADGIGVVLTGEGADEVFAGYAHLRSDLAGDRDDGGLAASNGASAGLMLPSGQGLDLSAVARAIGFVPTWMAAKATLGHRLRSLLSDDFIAMQGDRDAYGISLADVGVRRQLCGRSRVHQSLYLWNKSALATYILRTLGDGMEMAHSIEGRLPFLDHHLFAVARRLPIDLLIRGGVEKYVLRRAIGTRIPESIRQREKHPFLAPPLSLAQAEPIEAILRSRGAAIPDFIDRRRLRAAVERLPSLSEAERRAWDPALMLVASLCIQQQRYGC